LVNEIVLSGTPATLLIEIIIGDVSPVEVKDTLGQCIQDKLSKIPENGKH
jgi:hypothetical protein